jgi:hypothetical protein
LRPASQNAAHQHRDDCVSQSLRETAAARTADSVDLAPARDVLADRPTMLDLILILAVVAFFALATAYTHGCNRL